MATRMKAQTNPAASTVSSSPKRQPIPVLSVIPSVSGASNPTPAATALHSFIALADCAPWWSASVVDAVLINSE